MFLQGDFRKAGDTAGRFAINSTVGILGIWDPATKMGLEDHGKEDFGQTIGVWGSSSGCYFVLPILGPTTTRDAVGLVGNMFLDPVYQITHNTEITWQWLVRAIQNIIIGIIEEQDAVDFRAKNIESLKVSKKTLLTFMRP